MAFPVPSETFATNDVRMLKQMGVDVRVHALRSPGSGIEGLSRERRVHDVPTTHGTVRRVLQGLRIAAVRHAATRVLLGAIVTGCATRPAHLAKSLALLPRALDVFEDLSEDPPDVVHIYWGHYPAMVGLLVERLLPSVVVSVSLAAYDLEMEYGLTSRVANDAQMVRTLGRVNVPDVASLAGIPEASVDVIHDGVDLDALDAVLADSARPDRVHVPKRIVTAGRLIPSKGMDATLEAFHEVHSASSDATLHVLGDGPQRAALEARVRELGLDDAVVFRGHVSHETVISEMAEAEIFLFMSVKPSERLPNVVKEAMACGCMCVATDTPGIDELVADGVTGFVVPRGDVEAAADRVRELLSLPPERAAEMRRRARRHIEEGFRLAQCVERYVHRWRDLARTARDGHALGR